MGRRWEHKGLRYRSNTRELLPWLLKSSKEYVIEYLQKCNSNSSPPPNIALVCMVWCVCVRGRGGDRNLVGVKAKVPEAGRRVTFRMEDSFFLNDSWGAGGVRRVSTEKVKETK